MPLLRVQNLFKTYHLDRVTVPVLRGVDLNVTEGEFVAVLGASGSGKSTLLHLVGGLDRPDREPSGTIEFDARRLDRFSSGQMDQYRRADVGFVFQFYHLLPELNVLENVLLAAMVRHGLTGYLNNRASATREARETLDIMGLTPRLGHRPAELSGGERQRVAIARALVNMPRLLLADEPTGNLDRATGTKILDAILEVRARRKLTMIVVTHDEHTAARADRIVRLLDGRVTRES